MSDSALVATSTPERPHVVILGGGFAGLNLAKSLKKAPVRITLVDRQNHHLFQPLLYQVATAALSAPEIARPIRDVLRRQKNATVLLGEVTHIDLAHQQVMMGDDVLNYDYLYIATGASHSYFGQDQWADVAPGLKTLDDAIHIRQRMLLAYERAERRSDPVAREADLTFVVVGAGPTGVELAGALAEIARHTMAQNFRNFDPQSARVLLVEAGTRVLAAYDPALSENARLQLQELGVDVQLNTRVTDITDKGVMLGDVFVRSSTVLWAAGVQASPVGQWLHTDLDRSGRVIVNPDLTVPGHPEVSVLGDLAAVSMGEDKMVPGLAPAALQMGRYAGKRLKALLKGKPSEPFRYLDKGQMATLGRSRAIAQTGNIKMSGMIAWLGWALVHIYFLIGFRNRILVMREWIWHYITRKRGARILYTAGELQTGASRALPSGPTAALQDTEPALLSKPAPS